MSESDFSFVFYSEHVFEIKKLPFLSREEVISGFNSPVEVITDPQTLEKQLFEISGNESGKPRVLLLMSSGNFGGLDMGRL
jgi:hypothetical protein